MLGTQNAYVPFCAPQRGGPLNVQFLDMCADRVRENEAVMSPTDEYRAARRSNLARRVTGGRLVSSSCDYVRLNAYWVKRRLEGRCESC